jgi:glutathione S-transferase
MLLYYAPNSGSFVVEAILAELGLAYERQLIDIRKGDQASAGFRAVNPRGQVPALVLDGGEVLTESAAIALHLAESAGDEPGLLPPAGSAARGELLRWLFFAAANLYENDLRYYYPDRYGGEGACLEALRAAAARQFEANCDLLEREIAEGPFFFGQRMTLLDPYIAMLTEWHWEPARFYAARPKLKRLRDAVAARPAIAGLWREYFETGAQ